MVVLFLKIALVSENILELMAFSVIKLIGTNFLVYFYVIFV